MSRPQAWCKREVGALLACVPLIIRSYSACIPLILLDRSWVSCGALPVFRRSGCLPIPRLIHRDGVRAVLSNETRSGRVGRGKGMNAKRVMLSVLCATAGVGVAVWLAVEYQGRLRLGEENKALRQQLDHLVGLVTENERLSNLVAQVSRSQSLSDDQSRELLRLRGEVGVLRERAKELEILRQENRQARIALEYSFGTRIADGTEAIASAQYWPRGSWSFVGYATPEAALQSAVWAASKGDLKALLDSTAGEYHKEIEKDFASISESQLSAKFIADTARYKSVHVLNREVQADDTVVFTTVFYNETRALPSKVHLKKIGNEWKLSSRF